MKDALSEVTGGFDEDRVVQEIECLKRRIGADAIDNAFFAGRRVKVEQAGMQEGALPFGIEAAAVEISAVARGVFTLGKVHSGEITFRFERANAGSAEAVD